MENSIERVITDDGTVTVTVTGEIDFSNADELAENLRDAVTEWSPASVRVDLGTTSFIDSTGLGALIEGYRAATEADARFIVINPAASFRRVLTVTGLCDFFGLEEPDTSAVELSAGRATGA